MGDRLKQSRQSFGDTLDVRIDLKKPAARCLSKSIDRAAAISLSKPSVLSTASAQSNSRRLRSVSARAWASAFGGGVGIGSWIGSTMSPSFHS